MVSVPKHVPEPEPKKVLAAAPRQMSSTISPYAQSVIQNLNKALADGDFNELGDILFDCECDESLSSQIDIAWYQAKIVEAEMQ